MSDYYDNRWNVYAWNVKHSRHAVRVAEATSLERACDTVDAYLNKGLDWDAYMVKCSDDPGYVCAKENL